MRVRMNEVGMYELEQERIVRYGIVPLNVEYFREGLDVRDGHASR
jgi:hypothetical protein